MRKLENLGRILSQKEQEKITGGEYCISYGNICHPGYNVCCSGSYCRLYQAPFGYSCQW